MANPLLTDEQNRRLANQNNAYNKIMQGWELAQQQNQQQEDSWLGGVARGAKAGFGSLGAGLLHAGQAAFGTDGSMAASLDAMAENNAQRRDWDLADTLSLDYLTSPDGLAYGVGQIAGSMALSALFGAGVAAAVPTGGTSLLGTGALIGAAGAAPMAISEGGNTYAQGLQQGMTEDEAKKAGLIDAGIKLPFYMASEGLTGKLAQGLISKGILNAEGKSLARRAAESGAKILGNAANEAYEEGTENRSSAYALGDQRISSLGNIFNPFDWNDEDKAQAVGVFTPTLALGALTGSAGHLRSRFGKKNSDISEEIASEDGGNIEDTPEVNVSGREAFINAIAGQESGGNYNAENGDTGAYGKYQIIPSNWPAWAEEAGIGADAPRTPENQEIVARFKLGQYYDKYGARGAAIAWYGGEGALNYSDEALNRKQGDNGEYPSINEYADEVLGRMGNVADSARIDDSEENYFDESNYTDDTILNSLSPARGFDVSHLESGEAQDRNSLLYGEKSRGKKAKPVPASEEVASFNQSFDNNKGQPAPNSLFVNSPRSWDAAERIYAARAKENAERKARAQAIANIANAQQQSFLNVLRNRAAQQWDNAEQEYKDRKQSGVQSLANIINARAAQKWDAKEADNARKAQAAQEKQAQVQNIARLLDARAAQQWDNAERNEGLKRTQAQALANLLNAKAAGQYDAAQRVYAGRAAEQAEKQRQQQAIANIINARAAQKFDEAETAEKFKFVPQRQSMYDGAMRRNLAAQNRVQPDALPSVEPTPVNHRALDGRNFLNDIVAAGRADYANGKRVSVPTAGQRRAPKMSADAKIWLRNYDSNRTTREFLRDAAAEVWNGDPKHPMKECRRLLNSARAARKEILQPIFDNMMQQGYKQGVEFIPIEDRRTMRESHNPMWYRNYYKENGKAPSKAAMYDIAEEIFFGRDKYGVGYYAGIDNAGMQQIVADNHAELDPINKYIEAYETLELKLKENPNYGKEWAEEAENKQTGQPATARNSEAEQAEAEHVPESNQDEVNKKAVSVEENIANGKKAIEKVISEHSDAIDAMTRDDVDGISFYYGTPGTGKKFKKGYGIAHMIAKRNSEGLDGETFVKRLPEVIAKGKITEQQTAPNGDRVLVKYGDITTVLSLYKDGNRQTWVVTGWDDSVFENKKETTPSDAAAVYDANSATSEGATRSRSNTDEVVSVTKSVAQPAENVKKINLPKGTTVDVSIVGDNSNIIQVKFNGAQGKGTGGIMGRAGYKWNGDKQVWQARKTDKKAMDVAEQLGYKAEETAETSDNKQFTNSLRDGIFKESNSRADDVLVSLNKNEADSSKKYIAKGNGYSTELADGIIRVKNAGKLAPKDNRFGFEIALKDYQKAAIERGNRLAGIKYLIQESARKGTEKWIENSPNENVKNVREKIYDEVRMQEEVERTYERVYPIIEKLLAKAGVEALDRDTLFKRNKENVSRNQQTDDKLKTQDVVQKGQSERNANNGVSESKAVADGKASNRKGDKQRDKNVEKFDSENKTQYSVMPKQTVYHGTNHIFNKFTLDHIREGDGALTHGYGLYFAADEQVANRYRSSTSEYSVGMEMTIDGVHYRYDSAREIFVGPNNEEITPGNGNPKEMIAQAFVDNENVKYTLEDLSQDDSKMGKEAYAIAKQADLKTSKGGATYEALIPSDDVILNEDKKFSEQPKAVQQGVEKSFKDIGADDVFEKIKSDNSYGNEIYAKLMQSLMGKSVEIDNYLAFADDNAEYAQQASELLNKNGVEGLSYWEKEDGYAYVVFSDEAIEIQRQYSVALEAIQRTREEVEAEIRAAFPNGRVEYVNGVPTITMPNGSKFQYSIRENIVVNAKEQRKADAAHGTSGARVQGFWKKFSANGVQRMLAVSQHSERGTAFHEAMHAAVDLALTEKEKQALYSYYQKKAAEQNRDVNEVLADAYRDWVLARQQKRGTMFGKFWQKVKDFCTRIKAIFDKGAEVERIMQDVESGRVYERGTNDHSVTKRIFFSKEEIQGQKGSGTTQVATTRTMYVKALKWLRNQYPEAKTVLDYGAGLGLGTDDMRSNNPDLSIDSYEPNPERWAGKEPPTYTNNTQINKDYDLILNTNVLNVVEKPIRDLIVKDIADHLNVGGKAMITTRGWNGDVNAAKKFKPADEHHAIWIDKGKNGFVFQKGFDGDELKNYIEELLGEGYVVEKTRPTFGKSSVSITRVKAKANTSAQNIYSGTESINPNEEYIQGINDTDAGKVNTLAKSFEDKGYVGRPVLLVENGNEGYIALTGSHRIEAAKQADVDLKAIVLENNEDTAQLIEARDDDKRENIAKQLYEEGAISKSAYDIIREENANNSTYYSVAPAQHKIANAFTNTERKGLIDSVKSFFKEHRKSLYDDWFDKNNPLKGFDALTKATGGLSVYDQAQSLPATTAGMLKALTEGTAAHIKAANQHLKNVKMKYNVTLAMAFDKINKKRMDEAHPTYLEQNGFDSWINAFGAYLGTERCLEMAQLARAQGKTYKFPKGLTESECREFAKNAPAEFKAAADIFYKVNDNMISIMEDAQVFDHALAQTLRTKYKKYCPLLRDFSDTAAADSFIGGLTEGGRGIGNVSVPLKKINIAGSERGVLNPLETILKSYAVMLNRAERNKVALMAVKNAKDADLHELIEEVPGTTADPKNCIFTVLVNGKKKAFKTTQDLYGPIVGYNLPAAGLMFGVARTAARMLRTGATMSPSFILRNVLRDTVFAGIASKNGFIPVVDTVRGAMALWKDPAMRAEFEAAGVTEFNFYSSQDARIKSLDAMAGAKPVSVWEMMKAVFSNLEAASDFFESSTRMGEYMKARQKGLSMEEAARAAREITLDFSRSGRVGEQVNQVVPFFNACLQGGDKLVRLFREDFVGTSLKVTEYIILPSLLIMAMNWDEDWYKDLDPDIKNNYWCLGRNIRIPKPQEAGVLFGSGIEALFEQAAGKDKEAVGNWLKAFFSNMVPGVVPTLFLPILEWQANYSYFKGRQLVGSKYQRLPDELQYNDYTSELSKGIGSALKVSPMKIDNLVRGYTGTMGALLWSMAGEPFAKANNLPKKRIGELPFIRDFNVTDANLSRPMNDFYDILDKANKQHAGYGVKGKPEAAVKGIRSAGSMISKIRKDIDKITHSNLSPERKRELIDKRKDKMNQIAKKVTERYGKYFD